MPLPAFLGKLIGLPVIESTLDKLIPDRNARKQAQDELEAALLEAATAGAADQAAVNKVEAAHASVFVAGWRPFIGWVCGSALALQFFVFPLVEFGMKVAGRGDVATPDVMTDNLFELMIGMLGLAGIRSFEKLKGVARER